MREFKAIFYTFEIESGFETAFSHLKSTFQYEFDSEAEAKKFVEETLNQKYISKKTKSGDTIYIPMAHIHRVEIVRNLT